jgi:predicted dehydrogenase
MDLELKEFLEWVRSGKGNRQCGPKLGNPDEAYVDLAMVDALLEAGKTGQVVPIAELP